MLCPNRLAQRGSHVVGIFRKFDSHQSRSDVALPGISGEVVMPTGRFCQLVPAVQQVGKVFH